ncbi:cysteine desulfurase family protein [Bifidobacterium crudilactis]|uniref:cysteine desulfurase family protein n=1 Tax=Bifidobacterium crudilactis TaxID=327277 RepID=UPI000556FA50|nr:cysteine desulfurase family protein [Bifidobacterium crudilactis]
MRDPDDSVRAAGNLYLDSAASEAADPDVIKAMLPYMLQEYANPSSVHAQGKAAAASLRKAKSEIAGHLGARAGEVIITSGGTESDNLAIKGIAMGMAGGDASQVSRTDIVISAIEHPSVRESAYWLERHFGYRVREAPVDADARIDLSRLREMVGARTALVSVMLANNEVGTIQPIREVARIAHSCGAVMHTDAVQAAGLIPISMADLGVDAMSISGHKFGTPKGMGVLLLRSSVPYEALISGGGQERGIRSGTENVAAAVAMAVALRKSLGALESRNALLLDSAHTLCEAVKRAIPGVILTGDQKHRLPGHVSMVFPGVSGEALLVELDVLGISCSSASACAAGRTQASPTLLAMGFDRVTAKSSLRMTFRRALSTTDIALIAGRLKDSVHALTV